MQKSQAFKPADSGPELSQLGDDDGLVVAQDDGLNGAFAVD